MLTRQLALTLALPLLLAAPLALTGCAVPQPDDTSTESDEPTGSRGDPVVSGTVDDAVAQSCVTSSVTPLSQQIIDEMRCMQPDALVDAPDAPNLVLGANVFAYLEKPGRDALAKALAAKPNASMHVNSMFRTIAQQYLLYRWYQSGRCGIGLAAKPGNSNHESGLALDVQETSSWRSALGAKGFTWLGSSDPVHYDYRGTGSHTLAGLDVKAFQRLWNRNHPSDLIAEDGAYGPATGSRLGKTPAKGFAVGATCTPPSSPTDYAGPSADPADELTPASDAETPVVDQDAPAGGDAATEPSTDAPNALELLDPSAASRSLSR